MKVIWLAVGGIVGAEGRSVWVHLLTVNGICAQTPPRSLHSSCVLLSSCSPLKGDMDGVTPLLFDAAENGHLEVVHALLGKGANVNQGA